MARVKGEKQEPEGVEGYLDPHDDFVFNPMQPTLDEVLARWAKTKFSEKLIRARGASSTFGSNETRLKKERAMAPSKKWFDKTERKEAKGMAKEKIRLAWYWQKKVTPRGEGLKPFKLEGIYVGVKLPKELQKEGVKVKVIYEPKSTKTRTKR
jgi:hypothetical protein